MKYKGREQSTNVEDRRGTSSGQPRVGGGIGCGTLVFILALFFLFGGGGNLFRSGGGSSGGQITYPGQTKQQPRTNSGGSGYQGQQRSSDELGDFVKVTLKDTENVWNKVFQEELGARYREPVLVLFENSVRSACGMASSRTGPFYCPADSKLYVDLSFYNELKNKFRAPGDFAMAYVIAHEVGHHVQNLLGITDQVQSQRRRISKKEYNDLSVRLELQADFLAGVWAKRANQMSGILEPGDIEEAIRAAHAIGDDHIQLQSQGYVIPGSFTHGTSEQRKRWFMLGYETGDITQGDTFNTNRL